MYRLCLKLTVKNNGITSFDVDFEHILIALLMLILNMSWPDGKLNS